MFSGECGNTAFNRVVYLLEDGQKTKEGRKESKKQTPSHFRVRNQPKGEVGSTRAEKLFGYYKTKRASSDRGR